MHGGHRVAALDQGLADQDDPGSVDDDTFGRLAPSIPDDRVLVAESGITGPHDVKRFVAEGARAVLVGETLVKGTDPRAAVADLVAAGSHPALRQRD